MPNPNITVDPMPRSKSSQRWLQEHFDDVYVKKAQQEGYRSRAVYKLQEVDEREQLIKKGMTIIDLGAAPGGWVQYAAKKLQGAGVIIALDILPMEPLPGVLCIHGDFQEDAVLQELLQQIPAKGVDLILSDMAPNMSGTSAVDIPRAMGLAELVIDLVDKVLNPGGTLFMKIFNGSGVDELIREIRRKFEKVVIKKPAASRARSRETYLLAKKFIVT